MKHTVARARTLIIISLVLVILVAAGFYFLFFYIPSATTVVRSYDCAEIGTVTSNSSSSTIAFSLMGIDLNLAIEPAASGLEIGSCVYTTTNVTIPIRCGPLCGNGLGDAYRYTKQLDLNLSFEQASIHSNYSVVLSTQGAKLFGLFLPYMQIYLNSRNVTWSTAPPSFEVPCSKNVPYYTGCSISRNSTSLTFEFPTNYDGSAFTGTYQLFVNSSEMLVP